MSDITRQILADNAGRDPERLTLKLARLAESPFSFLRGTCRRFYAQLPNAAVLERAPAAWCCGDLHLENFGSFKADNRQVYFDLNDFEEAALAPCTWDPLRLVASVLLAAREAKLKEGQGQVLAQTVLDGYAQTLAAGKARWVERDIAEGVVRDLLEGLRGRKRQDFLDRRTLRTEGGRWLRSDGEKALPASDEQAAVVTALIDALARTEPDPGFYRVRDVARRIAGTGSLGLARFVILIEGKGSPDGNYLLDLKRALPSSIASPLPQPSWGSEAARVVAVQQRMQAVSPAFLRAVELAGAPYVLRALQPSEDRIAAARWQDDTARLPGLMRTLGELTASAQLRSSGRDGSAIADALITFGRESTWRAELLAVAQAAAAAVERDWRDYSAFYQSGAVSAQS